MTVQPTEAGFFQGAAGGEGAPTAALKEVGDWVQGTILSQRVQPAKDLNTGQEKVDYKTGAPVFQLAVILQTDLRQWQGVTKVPLVDRQDPSKGYKDPSEDDGKRAIYIEQNKNLQFATARAVVEAGRPEAEGILNGGTLLVQVSGTREVGKPQPMKEHTVRYTPPSPSQGFMQQEQAAPPVPPAAPAAPPVPPAAPAAPPVPPAAPAAPPVPPAAPAAPPAGDPWAGAPAGGAPQPNQAPF